MNTLKRITKTIGLETFLTQYLFKCPYAAPYLADQFVNLVNWKSLAEFNDKHNDCWLPCEGHLPDDRKLNTGHLNAQQIANGFSEGRTYLVRHAERGLKIFSNIASEFYDIFHCPVDIQIYVSPQGTEGFDWHYDVEDVFVFQSQGEKEFRLLRNTVTPRPLPLMTSENCRFSFEKKSPEIRCWLKAGDWLYIPAGYWHKAKAITDSFHLSVGVLFQK